MLQGLINKSLFLALRAWCGSRALSSGFLPSIGSGIQTPPTFTSIHWTYDLQSRHSGEERVWTITQWVLWPDLKVEHTAPLEKNCFLNI